MEYSLINEIKYSEPIKQILYNRHIKEQDMERYLNTTDEDISPPEAFGEDLLFVVSRCLTRHINADHNAIIVVDSDADGFTSSSLLLNYLHDLFPSWIENRVRYIMHTGKQHGLNDCIDQVLEQSPQLVILPDSGTNDIKECKKLKDIGCDVIVLDHHLPEVNNNWALIINNQCCDYPNKELSGAGVVWQFCRYIDKLLKINNADNYTDLCALGCLSDMMSMQSIETKHLIHKGFKQVANPFFYYMKEKNSFSLKGKLTPMGVAFYITPFINAIVRSGTQEEKLLVFESMLKWKAFDELPSTKRGHSIGETEKRVEQAVRVATNVKARQTKIQNSMIEQLEGMIEDRGLLDHKVLLFLLQPGEIDKNIAGLVANKFMAKFQRPVAMLTYHEGLYQGSARGCDIVGITDFKGICEDSGYAEATIGHPGAFGLTIKDKNIEAYLEKTDEILKDMSDEPIYYVDYIWEADTIDPNAILTIAGLEDLFGKDFNEPLVAVKNLKITPEMVTIYDKKSLTIKLSLPNGISIMRFNATEEEVEKFRDNNTGYVKIDLVATSNANEWAGEVTPQLFISGYEIVDSNKYFF